jgi:broad specificity phosphatase PhoE
MARVIELRRHTDDRDHDALSDEGVDQALEIGQRLEGGYRVVATSGAQRATQTAACFLAAGCGGVAEGVIVEPGLRSDHEDRWKDAYQQAGSGELGALREAAPDFVAEDSRRLADALRRVLERLEGGQRALVVGHSPTNEAAVYGLTGQEVPPRGKGEGILVREDGGRYDVEPIE